MNGITDSAVRTHGETERKSMGLNMAVGLCQFGRIEIALFHKAISFSREFNQNPHFKDNIHLGNRDRFRRV